MDCPRCGAPRLPDRPCPKCGDGPVDGSLSRTGPFQRVLPAGTGTMVDAEYAAGPDTADPGQSPADFSQFPLDSIAVTIAPGSEADRSTPADTGPLSVGQAFGPRYTIVKLLGIGGMGAVYQAWDSELGIVVAVKVIRPEVAADPQVAQQMERRFKRELLLARQVTHRNVVRIHDLGQIEGIKYITMSFIEGHDLGTLLKEQGVLDIGRALPIIRTTAAGLVAAHEAHVVHRDLKPGNIMIDGEGQAILMDFGIARSADSGPPVAGPSRDARGGLAARAVAHPAAAGHTHDGAIVGTLEYMAPEQARGEPVDERADIYAFGLICYDMLAGRQHPEHASGAMEALMARMKEPPPSPRSINPQIPEALDSVITKCIQPDRANRYQSSAELAADIARLDDNGNWLPRQRLLTPARLLAAIALVATLVGTTWYFSRTPAPPREHAPMSVLVADFVNRTGDAALSGAVEQAMTLGLEGASFISAYPRNDAQKLATGLQAGSHLDERMSRLVSTREGINVILAGAVSRDGNRYSITARALDATADPATQPLAEATASASTREQVLTAIGSLAAKIRAGLGDTTPESVRLAAADTFTASSLDVVKTYSHAQDLQSAGRKAEALEAYQHAIAQDPQFGLAYSGAAIMAFELGRQELAQGYWSKVLTLLNRMSERERYRTLGIYYMGVVRNFDKAVENFNALVTRYPADRSGRANLALAYFWALNFPKALEEGRRAVELNPRNLLHRSNYALYAMYASDFPTASKETSEVLKRQPAFSVAYLPLAAAAVVAGDLPGAVEQYNRMSASGPEGPSLATLGLGDLAIYQGRYTDAITTLKAGIAADRAVGNTAGLAAKETALAEAYEGLGAKRDAKAAAAEAVKLARAPAIRVAAASILLRAGDENDAKTIAADLSRRLESQERAYGKVVEGLIAMKQRRAVDAVEAFLAAKKLADLWLARFYLGVAYVEADHFAEGLAELDACAKRRGEAVAISLDETPSIRYLATLPYWLARAQDGVGMTGPAADSFKDFLKTRSRNASDPMVVDARRRLGSR